MNLQQEIEFKGVKQFFQWWFSELEFLIPTVIKKVFFRPQVQLNFELKDQQLTVTQLAQQSTAAVVKHFPLTEAGQQGFERWISKLRADNVVHCVFKLNPGQALEKTVILPAAAKDNFKQLIGYELARITPFNPQQIYYDAKILTLPDDLQVKVYLVVVPRKVVDQVMGYLKAWQIPVKQVYYTDDSEVTEVIALQCNLLPEKREVPRVNNWQTYSRLGLSALVVLLLATILFFPMLSQQYFLKKVKEDVNADQKSIRKLNYEQSLLKTQIADANLLIAKKKAMPDVLAVLTELTARLDNQTYLVGFVYKESALSIEGYSAAASSLIATLESSTMLKDVHFSSSVKQNKRTGLERFKIKMTVLST